jgi:hypothetical protein
LGALRLGVVVVFVWKKFVLPEEAYELKMRHPPQEVEAVPSFGNFVLVQEGSSENSAPKSANSFCQSGGPDPIRH